MELSDNHTQLQLRAWSNARQALGPDQHDALTQPTNPTTRIAHIFSSATQGGRMVETRTTDLELSATRRGGSPTVGRKPNHRTHTAAQPLPGNADSPKRVRALTRLQIFVRVWKFLIGTDDPKALLGSWIIVALIVAAVFA